MKLAHLFLVVLFTTLPLGAQQPAAAASEIPIGIKSLDITIETIASGGFWQKGDVDGSYRVVILLEGWEHLSNKVFLQWVRQDRDNQTLVVDKTLHLAELDSHAGVRWRISAPKFVLSGKQSSLVFPAVSESGKKTFTVIPDASQSYKVTEAKK